MQACVGRAGSGQCGLRGRDLWKVEGGGMRGRVWGQRENGDILGNQ